MGSGLKLGRRFREYRSMVQGLVKDGTLTVGLFGTRHSIREDDMTNKKRHLTFSVIFFLLSVAALSPAQQFNTENLSALRYRYIGPVGNRVSAVAGVSGEPNVYYAGAASGGIFKTTDGGTHWQPI